LGDWLAANPADAELLRVLDSAVTRPAPSRVGESLDVEAALARVHARMDVGLVADEDARAPVPGPVPRPEDGVLPLRRPTGRVDAARARGARLGVGGLAAVAAALLAVTLARRDANQGPSTAAAAERVVTTPIGVRDSVTLPDGSRIVLAPGTRLVVAPGYGGSARDVTLEGQARFSVRHDEARPFSVRVRGAVVRDLGTEFTVRSAEADSVAVEVAVFEGSVALDAAGATPSAGQPPTGRGVVLGPGDRGEVRRDGRVEARRGAATSEDTAWTRGRLVFRGTPLSTVRTELRRWYGVDLRLADETLAQRRLTASFDGEPVDRVVDAIALAVGADVERSGDTVTLRRSARAPR
jgi:transmembrane sensor